ncbi:MAG: aminotransferase class I/II-fold pyridoxal phosphate-dependent enzyme, partial [Sedimentisphaerales bacterium]|nr:aminotransferase class I/II-fold pyridoxal phosphate-dependent enzyme [Sedimentisphaerales bacterium]
MMKADTIMLHGGQSSNGTGASVTPVYQTAAYAYTSAQELADVFAGKAPGYVYSRIANPTSVALEQRLAELEGGIGCITTSSGMAAIASAAMGLLRAGDEILSTSGIFGGTVSLFANTLSRFGIKTKFLQNNSSEELGKVISERTRLIFFETISNPAMDVPDIDRFAEVANKHNIILVADSTATTPILIRPKDFGAHLVIHSTSKFINGHGNAIGGAIIDTGLYNWRQGRFEDIALLAKRAGQMAFLSHLRNLIYRDLGGCASPMNSFLMLQGLEGLGMRMQRHCSNALALAQFLKSHKDVKWVNYPGLAESGYYGRVQKYFKGLGGGLLSFGLGGRESAFKFIDALKMARNLANIGDSKTLVIHPAST